VHFQARGSEFYYPDQGSGPWAYFYLFSERARAQAKKDLTGAATVV